MTRQMAGVDIACAKPRITSQEWTALEGARKENGEHNPPTTRVKSQRVEVGEGREALETGEEEDEQNNGKEEGKENATHPPQESRVNESTSQQSGVKIARWGGGGTRGL